MERSVSRGNDSSARQPEPRIPPGATAREGANMAITSTRPTTKFTYREIGLHDRLREAAREVPQKPALILGDRVVTYADLDAATDRVAAALVKRGVRKGDRVTLFMPNSIEFVLGFYGTR